MKKFVTFFITGAAAIVMTACGGGGSSGDNGSGTPPPQPPTQIKGGTASNPVPISLQYDNLISTDTSTNYFKFTGNQDDKLVLNVKLDRELTRSEKLNCSYKSSTFIEIYDEQLNPYTDPEFKTCRKELTVPLPDTGTYVIRFNYPDNSGIARAGSVMNGFVGSLPTLQNNGNNTIHQYNFYNYYKYNGKAGEKLIMHANLDRELERSEKLNCSYQRGHIDGTFIAIYDPELNWYSEFSTCDTDMTADLPNDGTYVIHIKYPENSGQLNVSSIAP